MDIQTIEKHAGDYAADRAHLAELVGRMKTEVDAVKWKHLKGIREAVAHVADRHDALDVALNASKHLFEEPRTRKFFGIKVGFRKKKGKVTIADEDKTIKLIRKLLPPDQAALLIRTREEVDKNACYDLIAGDLKRLGIEVTQDGDVVVIKPTDASVDKLVDDFLKDAEKIEAPE